MWCGGGFFFNFSIDRVKVKVTKNILIKQKQKKIDTCIVLLQKFTFGGEKAG